MSTHISIADNQIMEIVRSAKSFVDFKIICSVIVGMTDYLFGPDNHATMGMILLLIAFDFTSALMAAYHKKEEIQSRKALKTVAKIAVYGIFVSAAHLTEEILLGQTVIDEMAISFLAITELISIMENFGKMGYAMPQKMLNKLKDAQG